MRYGIAVWNFREEGVPLVRLVEEFADSGFDAVSFLPGQIVQCSDGEAQELLSLLRERDLVATVHGNFQMASADVETLVARLGDRLVALTMDAAMTADSCGHFYDGQKMAHFLAEIEDATDGTPLRFGVEDFPLDRLALDRYRDDLGPLLDCPRYGTLIDLGHLNLRVRQADYFRSMTPADYIRRVPLPIIEVHVHDNKGERDSHGPIGFGTVAFAEIAAALREVGFDGISTIEIAPSFHGSTPAASKPRASESLQAWRALWEESQATAGEATSQP
ncbi:MAG TPA: sugar phosphate isomerase/epimerase [Planctomycetota bacterium]|nr:sugar phosphate isomerase/epimerase [Planctomycetota bacterium]